jgi:glutathione gamma-glutamylcysteinyltransferase
VTQAPAPTLYRRPLPADAIAFASAEGRQLFAEALAAGGLDGYFRLAEQFQTQSDPAFCSLGSLVVALNALGVDPGRLWKGPWRWFSEELLDCCVSLEVVRRRGLSLDELGCLARCNGADAVVQHAEPDSLPAWRAALQAAARGDGVLIAAYDRAAMGQTGTGHYSPIGGYHAAGDAVLILDVARFKYPPHWVGAERLWHAMRPLDPETGRPRGWLTLTARGRAGALGYSLRCDQGGWAALATRLDDALAAGTSVPAVAAALAQLADQVELRSGPSEAHDAARAPVRAALRAHAAYATVEGVVGVAHAELVLLLMLALGVPAELVDARHVPELAAELESLRAQVAAVRTLAAPRAREA